MTAKPVSKTAGFTLAEVLAAMAILALTASSVLFLFMTATRLDAAGYKLTIAQAAARLRMEELVGQTAVDSEQMTDRNDGFPVDVSVSPDYEGFPGLVHVAVTVYDADGVDVLCRLENVLNVTPGGL